MDIALWTLGPQRVKPAVRNRHNHHILGQLCKYPVLKRKLLDRKSRRRRHGINNARSLRQCLRHALCRMARGMGPLEHHIAIDIFQNLIKNLRRHPKLRDLFRPNFDTRTRQPRTRQNHTRFGSFPPHRVQKFLRLQNPVQNGMVKQTLMRWQKNKTPIFRIGPQISYNGFKMGIDINVDANIENIQRAPPPIEPGAPSGFAATDGIGFSFQQFLFFSSNPERSRHPPGKTHPALQLRKLLPTPNIGIFQKASPSRTREQIGNFHARNTLPNAVNLRVHIVYELHGQINHIPRQITILLPIPIQPGTQLGGILLMRVQKFNQQRLDVQHIVIYPIQIHIVRLAQPRQRHLCIHNNLPHRHAKPAKICQIIIPR